VVRFGPFSLTVQKRLLLKDGQPARIGGRALELLIVLLERHNELIGKKELIARVWQRTTVGEGNLAVQMTALRRVLRDGRDGNRFIVNQPSRGYSFVAPVTVADSPVRVAPSAAHPVPPDDVSASVLRLVEVCCTLETSRQLSAAVSVADDIGKGADEILQRGIWALEFARTLFSINSHQSGPSLNGFPTPDGHTMSDSHPLTRRRTKDLARSGGWAH
jgi:DNA-binding winged helix-turn-helix (wHTH) protein